MTSFDGHADRHSYLGPAGTFTESALRAVVRDGAHRISRPSITAALDAVRYDAFADATVPWENSTAGTVAETIRGLALGEPLIIRREVVMPVELVLAVPSRTALPDVVRILSHPHALAQAEPWLAEVSPAAAQVQVQSTARAAEAVSPGRGTPGDAAICSESTAGMYGLEVIARPPAGAVPAMTRFVVVGRPLAPASTSLAVPDADEPITTTLLLYLPTSGDPENAEAALKDAGFGGYCTDRDTTAIAGGRRCRCVHLPGDLPATAIRQVVTHLRRRDIGIRYLGGYPAVHPAELPVGSRVPITDADNHEAA